MKRHVKKYFILWYEKRIDEKKREKIEKHLCSCKSCRTYFKKMELLFDSSKTIDLPMINPSDIHQVTSPAYSEKLQFGDDKLISWKLVVLYTGLLIFAIITGIWLGKDINKFYTMEGSIYQLVQEDRRILEESFLDYKSFLEVITEEETNEN